MAHDPTAARRGPDHDAIPTKLGGDLDYIARELHVELTRAVYTGDTIGHEPARRGGPAVRESRRRAPLKPHVITAPHTIAVRTVMRRRGMTVPLALACALACAVSFGLSSRAAFAEPTRDPPKRVLTACAITWAATALPMALAALGSERDPDGNSPTAIAFGSIGIAGLVLGPSAGHWYAGNWLPPGLLLRTGAAITVATLVLADPRLDHPSITVPALVTAAGLWAGSVVWDIATVPRAVHRANLRPVVTARGIALAGTF